MFCFKIWTRDICSKQGQYLFIFARMSVCLFTFYNVYNENMFTIEIESLVENIWRKKSRFLIKKIFNCLKKFIIYKKFE